MKKVTFLLMLALVFCSCNSKGKKIPDKDLKEIAKEIFITNAYMREKHMYTYDTISVYEPILERYGYKPKDLDYTLYKMSLRKSSSISEIIQEVVAEMDTTYMAMTAQRNLLDSIDMLIVDKFRDTLYHRDSTLTITNIKDLKKGVFEYKLTKGDYRISFTSEVGARDSNYTYFMDYKILDKNDSTIRSDNYYYSTSGKNQVLKELSITDTIARKIKISITNTSQVKKRTPQLTFDSIMISHTPLLKETKEKATKELINKFSPIEKILEYGKNTKDSIAINVVTPYALDTLRNSKLQRK